MTHGKKRYDAIEKNGEWYQQEIGRFPRLLKKGIKYVERRGALKVHTKKTKCRGYVGQRIPERLRVETV